MYRITTLAHPSGERLQTPLLVPSFSSKGFGNSKDGKSEIATIKNMADQFLTESMLLSAYDIHHKHIPLPDNAVTKLTYVDSGGYETSDLQDLSTSFIQRVDRKEWNEGLHLEILMRWPHHIPAVFVTYDNAAEPKTLAEQINAARALIAHFPQQLVTLLVKPETKDQRFAQIKTLISHVEELAGIPIIGVTEKELGASFIERMTHIARLRGALDDAGMKQTPIHIFGSLDPISVCLYFLAGAEIFDGLTWLRYGYWDGAAMYLHNGAVLRGLIHKRDDYAKLAAIQQNIDVLDDLANRLRKFAWKADYRFLDPQGVWLQNAHEHFLTKIGGA